MNAEDLNKNLLEQIKRKLPPGLSVTSFLMETLFLGREAIYRRIRGDVNFTFYEAYLLSQKLNFCLGSINLSQEEEKIYFELKQQKYYNLDEGDYKKYDDFIRIIKTATSEPYSEFAVSSNTVPQLPTQIFYHLGKFNSLRWIYQNQNIYSPQCFHEIDYTDQQFRLNKESIYETMKAKMTYYVWDKNIVESMVNEIKYFESIYLIKREDVLAIKKELHECLDFLDVIAKKGHFDNGNRVDIYISPINSDAAYCYMASDNTYISIIGAFVLNYVISTDKQVLMKMKDTILSRRRVATLISGSGEMERIAFFNKQHEIVETL